MNSLGYVTRVLLTLAGAVAGFAVISLASAGYIEMASLLLTTIMIPVSMIVYEYMMGR